MEKQKEHILDRSSENLALSNKLEAGASKMTKLGSEYATLQATTQALLKDAAQTAMQRNDFGHRLMCQAEIMNRLLPTLDELQQQHGQAGEALYIGIAALQQLGAEHRGQ